MSARYDPYSSTNPRNSSSGGGLGSAAAGAAAGSALGPVGAVVGGLGGLLSGAFGGQEGYNPGKLHTQYTDPYQGLLTQGLMRNYMAGRGDFGFGRAVKQGKGQLQQMMADRGIRPDSGVYQGAMGNMVAGAASNASANRLGYGMQLAGMTPQTMTSGEGWDATPGNLAAYNPSLLGARQQGAIGYNRGAIDPDTMGNLRNLGFV